MLTGPNMLIVGQLGRGKSAFLKSYIARQHIFGREAWVLDPKGEFAPLAEAIGGSVIALRPGGSVRLNAISSRMGRQDAVEPFALGGLSGAAARAFPRRGRRAASRAESSQRERTRRARRCPKSSGAASPRRGDDARAGDEHRRLRRGDATGGARAATPLPRRSARHVRRARPAPGSTWTRAWSCST